MHPPPPQPVSELHLAFWSDMLVTELCPPPPPPPFSCCSFETEQLLKPKFPNLNQNSRFLLRRTVCGHDHRTTNYSTAFHLLITERWSAAGVGGEKRRRKRHGRSRSFRKMNPVLSCQTWSFLGFVHKDGKMFINSPKISLFKLVEPYLTQPHTPSLKGKQCL